MGWRNWARQVLNLPVCWPDFYGTNAVVVAVGVAQAQLAQALPVIPLIFASLMLINAVFFHILPTILKRVYSPGTVTAVLLFLPLGFALFRAAIARGLADVATCLATILGGALLMADPVVMLKIRNRHFAACANMIRVNNGPASFRILAVGVLFWLLGDRWGDACIRQAGYTATRKQPCSRHGLNPMSL